MLQSGGRFSELRPKYQGCRALTFVLARLSCTQLSHLELILRNVSTICPEMLKKIFLKKISSYACYTIPNVLRAIILYRRTLAIRDHRLTLSVRAKKTTERKKQSEDESVLLYPGRFPVFSRVVCGA